MGRPSHYAHAAFALAWAAETDTPVTDRGRAAHGALLEAADTHPHVGLVAQVAEAARHEARRAAGEQQRQGVYDHHKRLLAGLVARLLAHVDVAAVTAAAVALAATEHALGATPPQRRRAVAQTVGADLRKAMPSDLRAEWDQTNAEAYTQAYAQGAAEADATPTGGGPHTPAHVDARRDAAVLAVPAMAATLRGAAWTDRQVASLGMGAALAAGNGAEASAAAHAAAKALTAGGDSAAARALEDDLHATVMGAYAATVAATRPTAQLDFVTQQDGRVCPLCYEIEGENPWPADSAPIPPQHPTCRCHLEVADALVPADASMAAA